MAERANSLAAGAIPEQGELVKGLGLFSATMLVVGTMIGSGIFIVSADITNQVQSPGLPYRAFGYPVLPALYLVMALFLEVQLLRYKPQYTWPGLIIVLLGVPVYWVWKKSAGLKPLSG